MQVILKYFDSNGHNFGIVNPTIDTTLVERVYLTLPDQEEKELQAIQAYRKWGVPTLRSVKIDEWLRSHYHPGQSFSAIMRISEDGAEHHLSDITAL